MGSLVQRKPIVMYSAPAKLTTHLHVTGVRSDGYHLIDAEMVSLDLGDELRFEAGDGLVIDGPHTFEARRDNLVTQALDLVDRTALVRLTKNIPAGGGLGGGSSDAAAVLRWAERAEIDLAVQLGADVPFCLQGGRARVRGIGEEIEPQPFVAQTYTLLMPPFGVDTRAVYARWDSLQTTEGPNHLEASAQEVEPRLKAWRERFADWTGAQPVLAGSGSTMFVEGAFAQPPDIGDAGWIIAKSVPAY